MRKIEPEKIERIMIRAANWIGDAVMSTPMIRAIRKNFPKAHIHILAKPWVASVFENNPDIDNIIIYDNQGRHKGWHGVIRLGRDLRKYGFDLAVLVQNAFEAALISFLAGIPKRLGYNTDGRFFLLTHGIAWGPDQKKLHQIDYYLGIIKGASLKTYGRHLTLNIMPYEIKEAYDILKNHGYKGSGPVLGINPGAAYGTAKRWPKEKFVSLCRRLKKKFHNNLTVLIFGSPGEKELGAEISAKAGAINLCGKTNLRQAMALIGLCNLFITNDSGLMHVAAALDVPLIAIFGSTNYKTTSPFGIRSHMIRKPVSCSPCMKPECPLGHHECMESISVDEVYGHVDKCGLK